MFAYCGNNPVSRADTQGTLFFTVLGATVGAVLGALSAAIEGKTGDEFLADVLSGATSGAVSGAAADILTYTGGAVGVVAGVMAAAGAAGAIASNYVESQVLGEEMDWGETLADAAWDASLGALFGYMGGKVTSQLGNIAKEGFFNVATNLFKQGMQEFGENLACEVLGNVISDLGQFTGKIIQNKFEATVLTT